MNLVAFLKYGPGAEMLPLQVLVHSGLSLTLLWVPMVCHLDNVKSHQVNNVYTQVMRAGHPVNEMWSRWTKYKLHLLLPGKVPQHSHRLCQNKISVFQDWNLDIAKCNQMFVSPVFATQGKRAFLRIKILMS